MLVAIHRRTGGGAIAPRGMGAASTSTMPYAEWCDQASLWNPAAWALCLPHDISKKANDVVLGAAQVVNPAYYGDKPAPPAPPAPTITLGPSGEVFAGTDADGNPVYATPETADQNMDRYRGILQNFMASVDDAANPAGAGMPTWVWGVISVGIAAVVITGMNKGGRRR